MSEKSSGQIIGQLGKDFLPFGIASLPFAYTSYMTGAVELTVLGGLGTGFALTGAIVVGALAVPAAIMLAVGDTRDAGAIADAVHAVTGLISPGALVSFLAGTIVMPEDPVGFAKVGGYPVDFLTGGLTGSALDRLGALGSAAFGFGGWKSDAIELGNSYLTNQSSSTSGAAAGPGDGDNGSDQNPGGANPVLNGGRSPLLPSSPFNFGNGSLGGFPFDFSAPASGDDSSLSGLDFGPVNTLTVNINDLGITPDSGGSPPPSDASSGNLPASGDAGGDSNGSEDGSESGGEAPQPSPSPAPAPSPGGGDSGGGGDDGGGDDGGGGDWFGDD